LFIAGLFHYEHLFPLIILLLLLVLLLLPLLALLLPLSLFSLPPLLVLELLLQREFRTLLLTGLAFLTEGFLHALLVLLFLEF
jgi:hypothetical protein